MGTPYDAFICHASEDKRGVARPLAALLTEAGYSVWYDDFSLRVGDSLVSAIDHGLANSRFGIVVISPSFFAKDFPKKELAALIARESDTGAKIVLPVWHRVTRKVVLEFSPLLSDRWALNTRKGLRHVCTQLRSEMGRPLSAVTDTVEEENELWLDQMGPFPEKFMKGALYDAFPAGSTYGSVDPTKVGYPIGYDLVIFGKKMDASSWEDTHVYYAFFYKPSGIGDVEWLSFIDFTRSVLNVESSYLLVSDAPVDIRDPEVADRIWAHVEKNRFPRPGGRQTKIWVLVETYGLEADEMTERLSEAERTFCRLHESGN